MLILAIVAPLGLAVMDLTFYGLQHHPFSDTADLALLFVSQRYKAALQALIASLKAGKTLVTLLGEPGVGKTFLLHTALTHRDLKSGHIL
jgi:type II secretory pathway predicted ATPase ExeA